MLSLTRATDVFFLVISFFHSFSIRPFFFCPPFNSRRLSGPPRLLQVLYNCAREPEMNGPANGRLPRCCCGCWPVLSLSISRSPGAISTKWILITAEDDTLPLPFFLPSLVPPPISLGSRFYSSATSTRRGREHQRVEGLSSGRFYFSPRRVRRPPVEI